MTRERGRDGTESRRWFGERGDGGEGGSFSSAPGSVSWHRMFPPAAFRTRHWWESTVIDSGAATELFCGGVKLADLKNYLLHLQHHILFSPRHFNSNSHM
jgi:hypothetical protein